MKTEVSKWLLYGSCLIAAVIILVDYLNNLQITPNVYEALGRTTWTIISIAVSIWAGIKCAGWAASIQRSPNWAYLIGYCFSLPGLLCYFLYYKLRPTATPVVAAASNE